MNNVINTLFDDLKKSNKVVYLNSSRTELSCRCPYCGDSVKNASSAHLYIKTEAPFSFFCQKCESSGLLNQQLLSDLLVDNSDLSHLIKVEMNEFKKSNLTNKVSIQKSRQLKIPTPQSDFDWKREYIENRLGCEITKKDILNLRIIPHLEDLLVLNKMEKMLDNKSFREKCYDIDKNGVGWLSQDNSHAVFRMVNGPYRYRNIKLTNSVVSSKVYTVKNKIDILSNKFTIILTEGIFDVLSVFKNLFNGENNPDRLFVASNGKGFSYFPLRFQREYGFLNLDLHIYSDNDVSLDYYKDLFKFNKRFSEVNIFFNTFKGEKDFGVPLNKIEVRKCCLN